MANGANVFEGAQFLLDAGATRIDDVGGAADEFDRFGESAGGFALPDFAETAFSQRFEEAIAGNGFGLGASYLGNRRVPVPRGVEGAKVVPESVASQDLGSAKYVGHG